MNNKTFLPPEQEPRNAAFNFKDAVMKPIDNTTLFNSYIKNLTFKREFAECLWSEGPCYVPHLDMLVWSDIPRNRMMKLENNKVSEFRNPSNFCNGNTIDNDENIISCSHGGRCIYKTDDNLNVTVLVDKFREKKLNSPNDVCVKSDGTIWFTDPPYGILGDYEGYPNKQEYHGCYVFK